MAIFDAIVLGGGTGARYSESAPANMATLPKQFQTLGSAPVFVHSIRRLADRGKFRNILVTVPAPYLSTAKKQIENHLEPQVAAQVHVIVGGHHRQESARLALNAVATLSASAPERVLIHDACRPILSEEFLSRVMACLEDRSYGAWVPVIPVTETLKKVSHQRVVETVDRQHIHRVQTPQVFEYSLIKSLHDRVHSEEGVTFTDDASLCEHYGIPVGVFAGDFRNIKLTYHFELETLRLMLKEVEGVSPCAQESVLTSTV